MIIGIDIGGTKTTIGLSHNGESIDDSITISTPQNQRKVGEMLRYEVRKLIGHDNVDAIAICAPAPIDKRRGMILAPHNIPWRNLRICAPLQKVFNCPVVIEHDATAGGIAEARFGAGRKYNLFCYVTISTGVGGVIMYNNSPLPTPHNAEFGAQIVEGEHIGMSTLSGSFEHLASGRAIERDFGARASEIHNRHEWQLIARRMSYGLYNISQIVAPEAIILGGGVAVHYKRFARTLQKELQQYQPLYALPKILPAKHIETAPLLGSIYLAAQQLDKS